ncbi:zinc-dependent metalloprotease [Kocuria sp.]|uniref:zinc-dependent metalloprotease n=1 Tax=Kocuria sp. TaxID=1871328 RepID=UPI0026DCE3CC|nr:zinc-dependent metalloprotease [Kocuria sp.]MDO4918898.1 zinc-dependent metalloprotease [Kocuria sp.]
MPANPPNDENGQNPQDPFREMFERLMGSGAMKPGDMPAGMPVDPQSMSMIFQQIQSMMSSSNSGDPVNWELANQNARQVAAQKGDPSVTDRQKGAVSDAMKLADLWLKDNTAFDEAPVMPAAWARAEWIEATWETWQEMTTPVAASVTQAMSQALTQQLPPELSQAMGGADLSGMLSGAGSMMFGMQLGQAVGALSCEVLSSTDVGIPLAAQRCALVPSNIAEFSEDLDLPASDVLLYLAIREAAHIRLFHGVPWLRQYVLDLITAFASEIHIDMDRIESIARDLDPSDPSGIQDALSSGVFSPEMTPQQEAALARLETVLALVEGWVNRVTVASTVNIPSAPALTEMMARRRAEGGPAERTFGALVGLELRPRRMREAAAFWDYVAEQRGITERDSLWESPELLPTDEDLDDPQGFEERRGLLTASDEEMDAALEKLLAGGYEEGEAPAAGTATDGGAEGTGNTGAGNSDAGTSGAEGPGTEDGSGSTDDDDRNGPAAPGPVAS